MEKVMIDNSAYKLAQQSLEHSEWKLNNTKEWIKDQEHERELKKAADEIIALKNRNQELENLLSRPLKQIAQEHPEFKKNYDVVISAYKEAQDEILAGWILSQKAYKETAMQIGIEVGKTPQEIKEIANKNEEVVLNNQSEIDSGNNASTSKILTDNLSAIIAKRKKN